MAKKEIVNVQLYNKVTDKGLKIKKLAERMGLREAAFSYRLRYVPLTKWPEWQLRQLENEGLIELEDDRAY